MAYPCLRYTGFKADKQKNVSHSRNHKFVSNRKARLEVREKRVYDSAQN